MYKFLCKFQEEESISWYCRKCTVTHKKLFQTVTKLEKAHANLEEKVDSVLDKLQKTEKDLSLDEVQGCVEKALDVRSQEDKEEEAERLKRKTSVIVHGVSESDSSDSHQRESDDLCVLASMMHELDSDDVKMSKVIRLGKKQSQDQ